METGALTKSNNMERKVAIERLLKAQTVQQWNDIRDEIKGELSTDDLGYIDQSGLITHVLGRDEPK